MPVRAEEVERYVHDLADRLGAGALLPGERELAATSGASRMTVRRALDLLEQRRVVERRHGAGTFVRRPDLAQPLMATSFHEDMARRGFDATSQLRSTTSIPAGVEMATRLEIEPGDAVLVVDRLRFAGGEPMALERLHVPTGRIDGLTGADLDGGASYYRLLSERYGRRVTSGRQSVAPAVLDRADAEALGVDGGVAAFRFVRVSRDQDGEVVELVDALYRADRYLIEIDIAPAREAAS